MKILTSLFLMLFTLTFFASATDYIFLATEDRLYNNPENWYPSYPGSRISFEDRIVIQADASFEGFNLIIEGFLEIELGSSLTSATNSILIRQLGILDNYGKIDVYSMINYGEFANNVSSELILKNYVSKPSGITNNFLSAKFQVQGDVINDGVFNNYSYCEVGQNLKNTHIFNQIKASELLVTGIMLKFPGAELNHSEESVAQIKTIIEQ